jgi:hypothetical protein
MLVRGTSSQSCGLDCCGVTAPVHQCHARNRGNIRGGKSWVWRPVLEPQPKSRRHLRFPYRAQQRVIALFNRAKATPDRRHGSVIGVYLNGSTWLPLASTRLAVGHLFSPLCQTSPTEFSKLSQYPFAASRSLHQRVTRIPQDGPDFQRQARKANTRATPIKSARVLG